MASRCKIREDTLSFSEQQIISSRHHMGAQSKRDHGRCQDLRDNMWCAFNARWIRISRGVQCIWSWWQAWCIASFVFAFRLQHIDSAHAQAVYEVYGLAAMTWLPPFVIGFSHDYETGPVLTGKKTVKTSAPSANIIKQPAAQLFFSAATRHHIYEPWSRCTYPTPEWQELFLYDHRSAVRHSVRAWTQQHIQKQGDVHSVSERNDAPFAPNVKIGFGTG